MAGNISLPRGKIIYAIGSGLYSINLVTKQTKELYSIPNGEINTVSQISSDWLLLGMNTVSSGKIIARFNLKTKKIFIIGHGSSPLYLSEHQQVLFSTLDGIYVAKLNDISNKRRLAKQCNIDNIPIFSISRNSAIFVTYDCKQQKHVWLYDVKNNKLQALSFPEFMPLLWRNKMEQVVSASEKRKYYLSSIDGKYHQELVIEKAAHPVLYLPNTDQLILRIGEVKWPAGETYDLGVYDFQTGKEEIISRNNGFALGAGIYLSENK